VTRSSVFPRCSICGSLHARRFHLENPALCEDCASQQACPKGMVIEELVARLGFEIRGPNNDDVPPSDDGHVA
jgi:hypothetical protein